MAKKDDKDKEKDSEKEPSKGAKSQSGEGGDDAPPSPRKKKLLLFIGIGAIGLIAAGVGGFFVMKTLSAPSPELAAEALPDDAAEGDDHEATEGHEADEHESEDHESDAEAGSEHDPSAKDQKGPEDVFGDTLDLPRMELNLGNPLENRFLRFGLSIEYHGGEAQLESLQRRKPLIKDLVISLISKKTRIELLSPTGKESFRKQLKNTLNEVLEKPITNVYFTEFLVE